MWWFAALHANLMLLYRKMKPGSSPVRPLLDAGCGTGGFLARLAAGLPAARVIGIDADQTACSWAAAKSGRSVCAGSVNDLPFADAVFATIFSVDVLCHRGVDEMRTLAQFHRVLAAEGLLILNLPAYRWMMSGHDRAVANERRYTRRGVIELLRAAGFRPLYAGYWNTLLFPVMAMTRKLRPATSGSDVETPSRLAECVGRAATAIERTLLRTGLRLPFGGSVLAVAAKIGGADG
jgi:SAM-dependent methyltransferase